MEEEELQQLAVEEHLEQVFAPRLVEGEELQQPMSKDNREEFFQELFEEEPICNVSL